MPNPRTSVVLACRNEGRHIDECLGSLLAQEPPQGGFEIVVADGMSEDDTPQRLEAIARANPSVRIIANPKKTTPCGLNAAIMAACGEIIVRVDGHTEYAPDYLRQCVQVLEETGMDNVGGAARTLAVGWIQRANAAAYHSPFSTGGGRFHNEEFEGEVDTVPYGCWRRSLLLELGLFDEQLVRNQDDELNFRLRQRGGRIWQSPSIKSWYRPRASLYWLFRQYYQYGYFKVLVMRKRGGVASPRHLAPVLFVLLLTIGGLLSFASSVFASLYFLGAGCYLAANAYASMLAARRHGWDLLPILPLVFFTYHTSYGLGFTHGCVDFLLRTIDPDCTANSISVSRHTPSRQDDQLDAQAA